MIQRPDIPVRTRRSLGAWWTIWVIRPAWLWRREYGAGLVLAGSGVPGYLVAGWVGVVVVPVGVVATVAVVPEGRRAAARIWRRGRLRRRWDAACRFAGLASSNDRVPRIIRESQVPAGERLTVRMPKGAVVADLEGQAEHVAAVMKLRDLRVSRDPDRADWAHVQLVRRDPFRNPQTGEQVILPWPLLDAEQVRLWEPIPVGIDELGEPVLLSMAGKNLLLGGEPGGGKSAAMSLLLAAAALDPWCRVWGLDAKRLELALWMPIMERVVYADIDEAISLMEELVSIMDDRYEDLERQGVRKIVAGGELLFVVIDELRFYTANPNKKAAAKFCGLAIDVKARGRACGIIEVDATQRPSVDVVPSSLRDLSAYRWAMRCSTNAASDTILGAGSASQGFDASVIDVASRGVGLLLAEGSTNPVLLQSYYLEDDEIRHLALRGAALRREHGTARS